MTLLDLLESTDSKGRALFRVAEDFTYAIGPGCGITVPTGYVTNFASVPRVFYRLLSPTSLRHSAIVHDYLCNESFGPTLAESGYSRWMADCILYEAMVREGFGLPTRAAVFAAVRFWAWVSRAAK